jgi:hypothetical protein
LLIRSLRRATLQDGFQRDDRCGDGLSFGGRGHGLRLGRRRSGRFRGGLFGRGRTGGHGYDSPSVANPTESWVSLGDKALPHGDGMAWSSAAEPNPDTLDDPDRGRRGVAVISTAGRHAGAEL